MSVWMTLVFCPNVFTLGTYSSQYLPVGAPVTEVHPDEDSDRVLDAGASKGSGDENSERLDVVGDVALEKDNEGQQANVN